MKIKSLFFISKVFPKKHLYNEDPWKRKFNKMQNARLSSVSLIFEELEIASILKKVRLHNVLFLFEVITILLLLVKIAGSTAKQHLA